MKDHLIRAVASACQQAFGSEITPELARTDPQFGDYATNVAMQLARQLGKSPRDIADTLVGALQGSEGIRTVDVAGPGFINITVTDSLLTSALAAEPQRPLAGKVVVAEYSDPNPFKVLHAGHLYTTVTGDVIASLLENAGATVHRLNFGGDVGLHVGKTMWAICSYFGGEHPEKLEDVPAEARLEWLSERYVEGNDAYDRDEAAKAAIIEANKRVYELHEHDDHESPFARMYWTCREWSYKGFDALYAALQVHPFERYIPESEVTPLGVAIAQQALSDGVLAQSDGAVVFKGEEHGLHTRVFINSVGLPTYETKDLGLAATKWKDYAFDLGFIITANDIVEYMKVVLKVLSRYYPEVAERTTHLTHGVIKLPGGVKMSSRKGNILRAADILQAAQEANKAATGKNDADVELAAVKYAFLKNRIGGDIIYDPSESVALEGNSGPYIQYAHARACRILEKSDAGAVKQLEGELKPDERLLLSKITEYSEVVAQATAELMPHHICTYLYELAQVFNRFYESNRVIGDEREKERLALVAHYADTLRAGLALLHIPAPSSM